MLTVIVVDLPYARMSERERRPPLVLASFTEVSLLEHPPAHEIAPRALYGRTGGAEAVRQVTGAENGAAATMLEPVSLLPHVLHQVRELWGARRTDDLHAGPRQLLVARTSAVIVREPG